MKRTLLFLLLATVLTTLFAGEGADAQRRRRRRSRRRRPSTTSLARIPSCPARLSSIAECPDTGCGSGADPDPLLNKAKNRTDAPDPSGLRTMTLDAIRSLTQPGRWTAGSDRTPLEGAGKEGTPVVVTGFLKIAKQEHGESCNCGLDDPEGVNTDIHLVIVSRVTDPEASSVTMEMTPGFARQAMLTISPPASSRYKESS